MVHAHTGAASTAPSRGNRRRTLPLPRAAAGTASYKWTTASQGGEHLLDDPNSLVELLLADDQWWRQADDVSVGWNANGPWLVCRRQICRRCGEQ